MDLWHETHGAGASIFLIHAGVCDSRMWEPQWQALAQDHLAVRCDLRGFGRTPIAAEPYSHARDVVELLDQLKLGPYSLVGASLGGRVALEVALARPELVERLVLVGASLPGHPWSDRVRSFGDEEEAALARGDIEAAVEANLRMWVDGPDRRPEEVDPAVRRLVGEMQRRAFELQVPVWEQAEEELLVSDVGDRFVEVRVPTLVVVGEKDVSDIQVIAQRLASGIHGAGMATIRGAAHLPSLERPHDFDRLVTPFLSSPLHSPS